MQERLRRRVEALRVLDRGLGREQAVRQARLAVGRRVRVVRIGRVGAGVDVVAAVRHRRRCGTPAGSLRTSSSRPFPPTPWSTRRVTGSSDFWPAVGLRLAVGVEVARAAAVHEHPQRAGGRVRRSDLGPDDERLVPGDRARIRGVPVVVVLPAVGGRGADELDRGGAAGRRERQRARGGENDQGEHHRQRAHTKHGAEANDPLVPVQPLCASLRRWPVAPRTRPAHPQPRPRRPGTR